MLIGSRLVAALVPIIALAAVPAAPARADAGINVGTLTCQIGGGWGLVLGSARPLACTFAVYGGRLERYVGTVWKFGLDLGYTQNGVMVWTVFAPAFNLVPGALAGPFGPTAVMATNGLFTLPITSDANLQSELGSASQVWLEVAVGSDTFARQQPKPTA